MVFNLSGSPAVIYSDADMFRVLGGWMEDVCHRLEGGGLLGTSGTDPVTLQGVGRPGFEFDFRNDPLMVITPGTVATADRSAFVDRSLSFLRTIKGMLQSAGASESITLTNVVAGASFVAEVSVIVVEFNQMVTDVLAATGFPDIPSCPQIGP